MNRFAYCAAIFGLVTIAIVFPNPIVEGLVIASIAGLIMSNVP
jgi:hypothetical protein